MTVYDGLICNESVTVRGIVLQSAEPENLDGKDIYVMSFDDSDILPMKEASTYDDYMADESNYSIVQWREKKTPMRHWAIPFVTGHKYYMRWEYGLDFTQIVMDRVNWLWKNENDSYIWLVMPHYERREAVVVTSDVGNEFINSTIGSDENIPFFEMGDNVIFNDTNS